MFNLKLVVTTASSISKPIGLFGAIGEYGGRWRRICLCYVVRGVFERGLCWVRVYGV